MHRLFPISLLFLALILFRLGYVHGLFASAQSRQTSIPIPQPQSLPTVAMSTKDAASTQPAPTATQQAQADRSVAIDP